ncbi:MAG TPA: sigma-70 family RNA polymerase sigma factor, partial [Planctomycetota bacterium]|nr:sigma-70 family RNA polymerase sigma factor [Planctomycetota bacterium]
MLGSSLDRAFVRYARTGDPRALARVFDGSAQELYRLAWHLLGDRHAAEDLVQQTFVVAIEQASDFDRARRVLPWLCGILTHRALHARRQLRQRTTLAASAGARDAVVDPEAEASAREAAELVAAKVRALPEPYRQVLLLHLVHELSPKEVAEALARTDATVRTQLARGLDLLRKALPVGLAALAAGQVPPPIGLAAVREAVLAHADSAAAVTGAGAVTIAFTGVLAMKKVVLVAAAVVAALSSWLWWGSDPALPPNVEALERIAANAAPQQMPASPSPVLPSEVTRTEAPKAVDSGKAGLEVLVLWHDGTPAADIPVRVRQRPLDFEPWLRVARTGDDGIARFDDLPPGNANALTSRGVSADVELAAGALQHTTITLDRGTDVRGRVVDLHERPVAGATVWMSVIEKSDDSEPVAVTGPDGAFAIHGVGVNFVVTASAPGLGCAKEAWVGKKEIVLTLRPVPGTVIGTVLDPSGAPVIGARVLLGVTRSPRGGEHKRFSSFAISGQDLWPSRFLRTDAEGRFRSDGLPPIRWPLWVGAPGFGPSWQEVTVRADAVTEVTVHLAQGAIVRGRITDEAGAGVAGVEVNAFPYLPAPHELIGLGMEEGAEPPQWARMHTTTDATGSYQLQRVLVGKLRLHAWARASRCLAKVDCEVVEGQTFVWDAVLAPEVDPSWQRFHGVLVDEDGMALANWGLRVGDPKDVSNRNYPYNEFDTREGGSFRTNRLPPGRYPLFVKPHSPMIGAEVAAGEFDVANCPLRVVVPRADVPKARI